MKMQTKYFSLIGSFLLAGGAVLFLSMRTRTVPADRSLSFEILANGQASGGDMRVESLATKQLAKAASTEIVWLTDYDKALQQAKTENKLVLIDFFATWCAPCKMMQRTTFVDDRVRRQMNDFVPLKIDVDSQSEIAARYGIQSLPTIAVVRPDGDPVTGAIGYLDADRFLEVLFEAESTDQEETEQGILGRKAPNLGVKTWFNLPEGQDSVEVGDYRGKVVYLYGFQSWCPGCHKYGFPTLTKLIEHYKGEDEIVFVAVQTAFEGFGTNTPQSAKETADQYGLAIPVGHSGSAAERSTFMQRYRTGGTPWTAIIDREGIVRYNDFHIAPDGAVALIDQLLRINE